MMIDDSRECPDKVSFGWGGINYGPEYRQGFASTHSMTLAAIRRKYFPTKDQNVTASASLDLSFAGAFNPNLETSVGKAKVNQKRREIEVRVSVALADFAPGREHEFRDIFVGLLDTAVDRIAAHKDCARIGIDPDWLKSQWQKVRGEYLALSLPLPPFVPSEDTRPNSPNAAEYYFEFEGRADVARFAAAIRGKGLDVDWDEEADDDNDCVVRDTGKAERDLALEFELIAIAEGYGGTYDGWAAQ